MISEREAIRIDSWVREAVLTGARILTGGTRTGAYYAPTILTNTQPGMKVIRKEVFAPVFSIVPYDTIDEAIDAVNNSSYGLQAGVFTSSLEIAHSCSERLEVGGVIINDGSTFRMDNMPYGGVKLSGIGREGVRNAIADMSEPRLLVLRDLPR